MEAHVQHLYAYAVTENLPAGVKKVDPRFDLVKRGTAPYVEYLGAEENPAGVGWAYPGKDYGHSIVRDYLAPLISIQTEPGQDQELQALKEQLQTLRVENDQLRRQAETAAAEIKQPILRTLVSGFSDFSLEAF